MLKIFFAPLVALVALNMTVRPVYADVRLTPNACNLEQTLVSLNADTPTPVTFVNSTNQAIRVYWRNYSSNRVLYTTLPALVTRNPPI
jgi:hypothetical protein